MIISSTIELLWHLLRCTFKTSTFSISHIVGWLLHIIYSAWALTLTRLSLKVRRENHWIAEMVACYLGLWKPSCLTATIELFLAAHTIIMLERLLLRRGTEGIHLLLHYIMMNTLLHSIDVTIGCTVCFTSIWGSTYWRWYCRSRTVEIWGRMFFNLANRVLLIYSCNVIIVIIAIK